MEVSKREANRSLGYVVYCLAAVESFSDTNLPNALRLTLFGRQGLASLRRPRETFNGDQLPLRHSSGGTLGLSSAGG
ncbi:MAG: hypothetical protein ACTS46_00920 [Candidatus Hodgkinia cicadicola]